MERLPRYTPKFKSAASKHADALADKFGTYRITMTQPPLLIFPRPPTSQKILDKRNLRARIKIALTIIKAVAEQDADYAQRQNGVGFSKPDSSKGHAFAQLSVDAVVNNPTAVADVLRLARRYAGQASSLSQLTLL